MKKALKPLLITIAVLAVLGGAYLAMEVLFPEVEPEPTPTPTPTEAPWSGTLTEHDAATAARVTVTRPGEGEWTLQAFVDEFQLMSFEVVGRTDFRYNQSALRNLVNRCFTMTAERLDNHAGVLSDFGFGPEQTTARVTLRDGTSFAVEVGNRTPDGRRFYVKLEGSDTVYTAPEAHVNPLMITEDRIRNLIMIAPGEYKFESVERYAVLGGDRRNVDIIRVSQEELATAERAFPSELKVVAPVMADVSVDRLQELILDMFEYGLHASGVVEDHPADLSVYGLDEANATTMILTMRHQPEVVLRFGFSEGSYTYVMFGDEPAVLRIEGERLDFLRRTYNEFVSPFIWLYNIRDVKQVIYNFDGRRHVLTYNRVEDTEQWVFEGGIDGVPVSDTNLSQLFMRTIDIRIGQELPASFRPGRPDMTVDLVFQNDSRRRMTFHVLNDRQIAVGIEGVYQFFAHLPDVERLQAGIDYALAGRNLPRY
jgi:hypothetical protein